MVSWYSGAISLCNYFWQLLSQLELAGEEIEAEILRSKEVLAKEDGEDQLLSLFKKEDYSVIMENQQAENTKVVQDDTHSIHAYSISFFSW